MEKLIVFSVLIFTLNLGGVAMAYNSDKIRTEANAKLMRGYIADGIAFAEKKSESAESLADNANSRVDNIIKEQDGNTPVEVLDSRHDNINNRTYDTLPKRLDDFSASLNDKTNKTTIDFINDSSSLVAGAVIEVQGFFDKNDYTYGKYQVFEQTGAETWNALNVNGTTLYMTIYGEIKAGNNKKLRYKPTDGIVNVKLFGAVGDGVADDSDAIQYALHYIGNKYGEPRRFLGAVLYFPAGDYRITKGFELYNTHTQMIIRGDGWTSRLFCDDNAGTFSFFSINTSNGISNSLQIYNMKFIGCKTALIKTVNTTVGVDIIISQCWFYENDKVLSGNFVTLNFSNNVVEWCDTVALECANGDFRKVVIADNNFYYNSAWAIKITGTEGSTSKTSHMAITGNMFDQGRADILSSGAVYLKYCDKVELKGNVLNGLTPPSTKQGLHGIRLSYCTNVEVDNVVTGYGTNGLNADYCNGLIIKGIYAENTQSGVVVVSSNNVQINANANTNGGHGFEISSCNKISIFGLAYSNTANGINISSCNDFDITVKSTLNTNHGIYLSGCNRGMVSKCDIIGNNIVDNASFGGIVIASPTAISAQIRVKDCNCYGNLRSNIKIYNVCKDSRIENNYLNTDALSTIVDVGAINTVIQNNYSYAA
jgi:hypothetical protein